MKGTIESALRLCKNLRVNKEKTRTARIKEHYFLIYLFFVFMNRILCKEPAHWSFQCCTNTTSDTKSPWHKYMKQWVDAGSEKRMEIFNNNNNTYTFNWTRYKWFLDKIEMEFYRSGLTSMV